MSHQLTNFTDLPIQSRLNLLCEAPQPLVLSGPPGCAKSSWMKYMYTGIVAEVHGVRPEDVGYGEYRVTGKDAVEASGLAFPINQEGEMLTQYTKPAIIVEMEALAAQFAFVVFNFDELMQGSNDMLNMLSDALNPEQRTLNGWAIPENIILCGTGNRTKDKAGGAKRLPSHLTDRILHFELEIDVMGWIRDYGKEHCHPLITACAEAHQYTDGFFAQAVPTEDVSYCSLRSLTQVNRVFEAYLNGQDFDGSIPPVVERLFAGIIGHSAASTVIGFIAQYDKVPSKEDILRDPESAIVPDETGFQSLAGNIAVAAATDEESGEKVIQYLTRLRPDLQVTLATKLLTRSAKNGWRVGGPIAQQFIHKFHDLIPLADSAGW